MKHIKINLEEGANLEKISDILLQIKGIKSVEIVQNQMIESAPAKTETKVAEHKTSNDLENIIGTVLDIFLTPKKPK